jgi:phytoene dehydrogenase-like protein
MAASPVAVLSENKHKYIVIGGGISGLIAAKELRDKGEDSVLVIEASDKVGGRIRTDEVNGYLLDRGFQVFIDSYPAAKEAFDYDELQLRQFLPGAIVRYKNRFHLVSDPIRRPQDLLASLLNPIGSVTDKIKVGLFSQICKFTPLSNILDAKESSAMDLLQNQWALSDSMINKFFKPFYQGIYLSPLKDQSSVMMEFVFKMFTEGSATLPAYGMGSICERLAEKLPSDTIKLNTKVKAIKEVEGTGKIHVHGANAGSDTGEVVYEAEKVILATDAPSAAMVDVDGSTGGGLNEVSPPTPRSSLALYFGFEGMPPVKDPILVLNGENDLDSGVDATVNNVCFPSQVSSHYAPPGKSLASVTIVGSEDVLAMTDSELEESVRVQLAEWWGQATIAKWEFLKVPYMHIRRFHTCLCRHT